MRAHEEAEWTGMGINPELLNDLSELAEYAVKMLRCVPVQYRDAILDTLVVSIREGVEAISAQKH